MSLPDKRVIQTRAALLQAFTTLLTREEWGRVSIQMLCDEAQVSRSTFYGHFKNKGELMSYAFSATEAQLRSPLPGIGLDENGQLNTLRNMIPLISDHRALFRNTGSSSTGLPVYQRFKSLAMRLLIEEMRESQFAKHCTAHQLAFLAGGIFATIEHWQKDGYDVTPEKLIAQTNELLRQLVLSLAHY